MYFRISIVLYTLVERIELDIKKSSGLIMHPTALPSKYGIGDFGNTSKEFIDFPRGNIYKCMAGTSIRTY